MEDALIQSAMAEIAMWDAFAAGRTANATGFSSYSCCCMGCS